MPLTTVSGVPVLPSLADAELPTRVREVLADLLNAASAALVPRLGDCLDDFNRQLFSLASHVPSPGMESNYLQTLRSLQSKRTDVIPHFMAKLEAGLAVLRMPASHVSTPETQPALGAEGLALVDDSEQDEDSMARDMAMRHTSRHALPLHLLGQRLGVLAGAPALDAERNPVGPAMTIDYLRIAAERLELSLEARLLLLQSFERHLMAHYAEILDTLNLRLRDDGILPHLGFVTLRPRGTSGAQSKVTGQGARRLSPAAAHLKQSNHSEPAQHPPSWDESIPVAEQSGAQQPLPMHTLQQLLAAYRQTITPDAAHSATPALTAIGMEPQRIDALLGQLQQAQTPGDGFNTLRSQLVTRLQQEHGATAALSPQHEDALALLDILYQQIVPDIAPDSRSAAWLRQLQVPLLRVALHDPALFADATHPARQLLGAVAETGARWLDPQDVEPALLRTLQNAVDRVYRHYNGDLSVFETGAQELQRQLRDQQRKAQLAERRHVEAARGQEKLAIARLHASEVLQQHLGQRALEPFLHALLEQAWADVLTLTLLRHGDQSMQWQQRVGTTQRIVEIAEHNAGDGDATLAGQIESALASVGYHAEEAAVIARRLSGARPSGPDAAEQAAIAAQLKAKARLGAGLQTAHPATPAGARTPQQEDSYRQLRNLPFGTAIDMPDENGRNVRRRMAWYSTVTDNVLFVNARGQRIGEQSLDSVARLLASGKATVVSESHTALVDRAWQSTLQLLRGLGGREPAAPNAHTQS